MLELDFSDNEIIARTLRRLTYAPEQIPLTTSVPVVSTPGNPDSVKDVDGPDAVAPTVNGIPNDTKNEETMEGAREEHAVEIEEEERNTDQGSKSDKSTKSQNI